MKRHVYDSIETQLFDWESWSEIETGVFNFSNIILKIKLREFRPGKRFSNVVVDYQTSTITFYESIHDPSGHKFPLSLSILPHKLCTQF